MKTIDINKNQDSSANLKGAILHWVESDDQDVSVEYSKSSISHDPRSEDNTSVDVVISSGANIIEERIQYLRPSLEDVEPHEKNIFLNIEDFILPEEEVMPILKEKISERLSIPKDSFTLEDLVRIKTGEGSVNVISTDKNEVVIRTSSINIGTRFKRFEIHDINNEYGVGAPRNHANNDSSYIGGILKSRPMPDGIENLFISTKQVIKLMIYKYLKWKFPEISILYNSYDVYFLSDNVKDFELEWETGYNSLEVFVEFEEMPNWKYSGQYVLRAVNIDEVDNWLPIFGGDDIYELH